MTTFNLATPPPTPSEVEGGAEAPNTSYLNLKGEGRRERKMEGHPFIHLQSELYLFISQPETDNKICLVERDNHKQASRNGQTENWLSLQCS